MLFPESTNLTDFRDNLATHLRRLQSSKRPMLVTQRGKVRGVMLSPKQYEELSEAAALEHSREQLLRSMDDAARGRVEPAEAALLKLRAKFERPAKPKKARGR